MAAVTIDGSRAAERALLARSPRGPPDQPRTGPPQPPGRTGPSGPDRCWSWPPRAAARVWSGWAGIA